MSSHKLIDRVCAAAAVLALLLTLLFVNGEALGIRPASRAAGYEARLFDTSRVHTIDIVMDGWDSFLETCENEEYASCAVIIDGEAWQNVGLRAKGNTSLSMVSSLGSNRYSFKLEFDQYETGKTYYGLDKLCLNNLIQDNTCMKDYLTYRLMASFGAASPLCSYVYITVNGEDWGLYLAVEGLEESFLQRNYGSQYGELYKPDSMSFGGGRGNGKEFNMDNFQFPDRESFTPPEMPDRPAGQEGERPRLPDRQDRDGPGGAGPAGGMGGGPGGMGSADVKLQYIDDDPDSYSNILDSAKTEVTQADQERLIQSLKALSEGDVDHALDADAVLRYFVVHNFVVNGDSYTGSMIHNYYLYEKDGRLSMLPWDYNLAFGSFQALDASSAVNDPIDTPLSVTGSGDRPMIDWIFSSQEYTQRYHQYFREFLEAVDVNAIIEEAYGLIAPYVEKDPTRFCAYEEFEAGVETLKAFCRLRAESVSGQLAGTIPSTSLGQDNSPDSLVDASGLTLSDMGSMSQGGGFPGGRPNGDGGEGPLAQAGGDRQRPGAALEAGNFPGAGMPGSSGAPGGSPAEEPLEGSAPLLMSGSILVLLAGLVIAARYKRNGIR